MTRPTYECNTPCNCCWLIALFWLSIDHIQFCYADKVCLAAIVPDGQKVHGFGNWYNLGIAVYVDVFTFMCWLLHLVVFQGKDLRVRTQFIHVNHLHVYMSAIYMYTCTSLICIHVHHLYVYMYTIYMYTCTPFTCILCVHLLHVQVYIPSMCIYVHHLPIRVYKLHVFVYVV